MMIFLDTANPEEIRKAAETGLVDGITTNPTLASREDKPFKELVQEILSIVDGPVSIEAVSRDAQGMIREAREYAGWSENAVVKIPMTPEGMKAVKVLSQEGVKTNVTLVFSANQALLAAKAGASYVSPFLGRLDDRGHSGVGLLKSILEVYKAQDYGTRVIAASVRSPAHVLEAARLGCHVATVPPKVFWQLFDHPLTREGLEKFEQDWKKARK